MADNGDKLTRRQTVALAALLSSPTVAKAGTSRAAARSARGRDRGAKS
jgi:hypothetical protein